MRGQSCEPHTCQYLNRTALLGSGAASPVPTKHKGVYRYQSAQSRKRDFCGNNVRSSLAKGIDIGEDSGHELRASRVDPRNDRSSGYSSIGVA